MARILIVDDSPTEIYRFKTLLEKQGHEILEASNGADGVVRARAEQPDLVLMDVVMPGLNGFQATRQLVRGENTAHIPIIIVTTKDQETDKIWGQRQGACDYLAKPVEETVLLETVRRALDGNKEQRK